MNALPAEKDFDPYQGCLDAQCAWKNFGGLSVEEAYSRFCENPLCYQEDFMFMGWKAFVYYFPVIEKFLNEIEPEDETDDCEAWILGCGIESQVKEHKKRINEDMATKLKSLCDSVIVKFGKMDLNKTDKNRILKQWAKNRKQLERTSRWSQFLSRCALQS